MVRFHATAHLPNAVLVGACGPALSELLGSSENRINTPTLSNNESGNIAYRHPAIHAVAFNTRGMHNTILDLHHILNSKHKPTIINLTETIQSHIKSIWRDTLKDYKLTHTHTQNSTPTHYEDQPALFWPQDETYTRKPLPYKRRLTSRTT
jgi:hypothetical protein